MQLQRIAILPGRIVEGEKIATLGRSGTIDHQIEPPEPGDRFSDDTFGSLWPSQIGGTGDRPGQAGRRCFKGCRRTCAKQNPHATRRQSLGDTQADPARGATDNRRAPGERTSHG